MTRLALLCAVVAVLPACANDPVIIELNFPSTEAFVQSELARVMVFDLGEDELGTCPAIVGQAIAGTGGLTPSLDSTNVQVCAARDPGISFDEVGEGPKAFVATTILSNTVILAGCTVGEVYADAPRIVVHLAMTPRYAEIVTDPSPCRDEVDKCERGCR